MSRPGDRPIPANCGPLERRSAPGVGGWVGCPCAAVRAGHAPPGPATKHDCAYSAVVLPQAGRRAADQFWNITLLCSNDGDTSITMSFGSATEYPILNSDSRPFKILVSGTSDRLSE
jgi:hypothetical protein